MSNVFSWKISTFRFHCYGIFFIHPHLWECETLLNEIVMVGVLSWCCWHGTAQHDPTSYIEHKRRQVDNSITQGFSAITYWMHMNVLFGYSIPCDFSVEFSSTLHIFRHQNAFSKSCHEPYRKTSQHTRCITVFMHFDRV